MARRRRLLLDRARAVRVLEMGIAIPVYRPADSRPWLEDSGGGCLLSKMISKLGHFIPKRVPAPLLEMVDLPLGPSECEGHSQAFRVIGTNFCSPSRLGDVDCESDACSAPSQYIDLGPSRRTRTEQRSYATLLTITPKMRI